jgi:hypothetical protein
MVTPNLWGGALVILVTCLLAWSCIALLFAWDDSDGAREDRGRHALRGRFDDRR